MPGNLDRFWRFHSFVFSAFNDQFTNLYQTLETVFHQVFGQTPRSLKLGAASFSTPFSVFGYPNETLSLVFDILLLLLLLLLLYYYYFSPSCLIYY